MNRNTRTELANETLSIIEQGCYTNSHGAVVPLAEKIQHSVENTKLFTPCELEEYVHKCQKQHNGNTTFTVINETTLEAARRLVVDLDKNDVLCLNFASARNPGGGFLSGSQAQEESLARSSALYKTLQTARTYYEMNRKCGTALYTDHMILSPEVPVFRDDSGRLLVEPYSCGFLTAPAVNAGAVQKNEPKNVSAIEAIMARRIKMVLAVALQEKLHHLVLGAWGCGVFKNDPEEVARLFANELTGKGAFANCFETIVFAVLDKRSEYIINPFRQLFASKEL